MYKTILVPVIFDKDHDTSGAISVAQKLADDGATLTLLHVMEPLPAYVETQIPEQYLKESRSEIQSLLDELVATVPGATGDVAFGHAGRSIVTYAREHGIDCLVMASHKHGVGDYFVGSTADWVVRHVNCCVHVIR